MFCPTCGTPNADGAPACIKCGNRLAPPPGWGAPQGYPGAPQGYPGAPQGQAGPPQQGWGPPPQQQGWGPPQQGFGNYAAPAQFGLAPAAYSGAVGPKGTTRDPVTVLIFSFFCFYGVYVAWAMLSELQAYTQDDNFKPWKIFVPIYNLWFWHSEVPDQVSKAKRMAGCPNPYANGFYEHANVALYSLAKDLNEVWATSP
ncbi:zinc-ribbon domain-containing protein [Polyangium spumosum]|uniref:Zinc-ribbon domain-containing protein n=1 Tax=Polyangium spumosum TaxID=889282 RepID=A0A6N7PSG0_9BACT|nr:zinc-ribbon domain-containing protein [Polyangium spumosum]